MVFVNSKKFACESCIKGHRSSGCSHTDRPLYEIKKKGRPVSQCDKCRQLRQSRRVHSKCNCSSTEQGPSSQTETRRLVSGTKTRRFVPIAPALPNGIKDAFKSSSNSLASNPPSVRQRVDSLLNPCNCKDLWQCSCRHSDGTMASSRNGNSSSDLEILANAAAACCSTSRPLDRDPTWHGRGSPRREKHRTEHSHPPPELPPFLFSDDSPAQTPEVPDFPIMPPIKEIESLAGSGCTCGVDCNCPGCVEHRGPEHADHEHPNCGATCGTCVDNKHGIALPGFESSSTTSIIDRFFARAAALPAPPSNRKMAVGTNLDPMNVMVYPMTAIEKKERGVPFGLIEIPKLECCGGRCGCPPDNCGCGKSCDGCCSEHNHTKGSCGCGKACNGRCSEHARDNEAPNKDDMVSSTPVAGPSAPIIPIRSCCAGK
ncbi:copper-binding transcription factor [Stygiomarasmius scandens]|uniref:Copper-binding transcription factor n=1 Tax=Marasmiellus scandens TaxID=2682957 RepID=A0ABR1K025_9AGAR